MGKEGEMMARIRENFNNMEIPPHVAREIGLGANWNKDVSPKDMTAIIDTADRFSSTLRKLSENES